MLRSRCIHCTYLEALVLQNPLDGCILSVWRKLCLEYNTKGAVSHDLALCILHFSCFASQSILDLFANNLYILY